MKLLVNLFLVLVLYLLITAGSFGMVLMIWKLTGSAAFAFAGGLLMIFASATVLWIKGIEKVKNEK